MPDKAKKYTAGKLTVFWRPQMCIHSENCVRGLPDVFNPQRRPWVDAKAASAEAIMQTIDKCPSRALSYEMQGAPEKEPAGQAAVEIRVLKDGPFIVSGPVSLLDSDSNPIRTEEKVALCRCGASGNKPFCDGAHKKIGFAA